MSIWGYPPLAAALFLSLVTTAAGLDIAARRIPNVVTAALAASGLATQLLFRGPAAAGSGLIVGAVAVALLVPFWLKGGIGGGDVKLAGAVGFWLGIGLLPTYLLATALAGGVVAAACYAASAPKVRRSIRLTLRSVLWSQKLPVVSQEVPGRVSVPYGVAVTLGGVAALILGA